MLFYKEKSDGYWEKNEKQFTYFANSSAKKAISLA